MSIFGVLGGIWAPFRLQFLFQKSSKIQNPSPGALQKIIKKRPRCLKNGFGDVFWTCLFWKVGFERVLGGFWEDFGTILAEVKLSLEGRFVDLCAINFD